MQKPRLEIQTHGYEVDLVGARADRLILATVKSFFGSHGVAAEHVTGRSSDKAARGLYRLLNEPDVRDAVIDGAAKPNPPGGGQLNGVACRAASACTAIGFTITGAGGMLLADKWNGTVWRIRPTPLIPAAYDMGLPAIACPSASWCTAVSGYKNDDPGAVTLAEQWLPGPTAPASRPAMAASPVTPCGPPILGAAGIAAGTLHLPPWVRPQAITPAHNSASPAAPSLTWCRAR